MRDIIVYSRRGCHLCEELLVQLEPLCRGKASIRVRDVDTREEWADKFGLEVPVMFLDGLEVCRHRFDEQAVSAALNQSMSRPKG